MSTDVLRQAALEMAGCTDADDPAMMREMIKHIRKMAPEGDDNAAAAIKLLSALIATHPSEHVQPNFVMRTAHEFHSVGVGDERHVECEACGILFGVDDRGECPGAR